MQGFRKLGGFSKVLGQKQNANHAPVNQIAPSITANAVIGTQIAGDNGTWSGSNVFTYQWQRNTGSFVNIGGATSKNYTPVDADFGYALRLVVTHESGVSANSNTTNLTLELPVQSLGSELLTDGGLENWNSVTDLTSWTESIAGTSTVNRDASAHGGSFAARLDTDASNDLTGISQNLVNASGDFIEQLVWVKSPTGTLFRMDLGAVSVSHVPTTSYVRYRALTRALVANTSQSYFRSQASKSLYFDDGSDKKITPNVQLTAPSADIRLTQLYTLPTPDPGTQVWVMPRISNFATGNYLLVHLVYQSTTLQWDVTLYTVAANVRTSTAAAATNIGVTNGIRINCKGDLLDLQTTVDGGANWTTRGSQVNNSLYDTATGCNVMATSDVILGNTRYEPAA